MQQTIAHPAKTADTVGSFCVPVNQTTPANVGELFRGYHLHHAESMQYLATVLQREL